MTYLEWITNVEKIKVLEYRRMPEFVKSKIRANYTEYCETYNLAPQKIKI